jgi:hypothetical protein
MELQVEAIEACPRPKSEVRLEQLREIVTEHQAMKIDGHLVDVVTANAVVRVHDALDKPSNREKLMTASVPVMVSWVWRLLD